MPIKTAQQCKEELDQFKIKQEEYKKTGDKKILWDFMYPYFFDLAKSGLFKEVGKKITHLKVDTDDFCKDATLLIISRYSKNKEYTVEFPITAMRYCIRNLLYGTDAYCSKYEYDDIDPDTVKEQLDQTYYN